jgi:hypothetical protein
MSTTQEIEVCPQLDKLAEVKHQIELWNIEAVELGRSMEALAAALRIDASRIRFRGNSIVFNSRRKSSQLGRALVDLAKIRNVVLNLQVLHAQRKQLLVSGRESV